MERLFEFATNKFILDWIKPGTKMLDLACGGCQLIDYARSIGCDVVGVDIKPRRKDVIKHDLNKKLKFNNKTFDIVTCIDSLEHVRNVSLVFKEVYRILKDDGIFIITLPNSRWYKNNDHISYFTYKYIIQIIEMSKFKIGEERHYIEIPKLKIRIRFAKIPEPCFHFIFKLLKFN